MPTQFYFKTAADQPDFTTEVATRDFEPARPYPQNPLAIVYRTRFLQLRAYYTRPTVNTPHPSLPQVYFADDIDFQDRPGGVIEWTRVYVTIPTQWSDYESDSYNYPGYLYRAVPSQRGRNPFTHIVTTKVIKDYYLVGAIPNIETQFTNYDNLGASSWVVSLLNRTANIAPIPVCAGGTNAATLLAATGTGFHALEQVVAPGAGSYCTSVFVKKANTANVQIQLNGYGTIKGDARFDLSTGQPIGTPQSGWGIAAIGEGWWRINVSGNTNTTNVSLLLYVLNSNLSNSYVASNESIYVWRAQMMTGLSAGHASVPPTLASDGSTNYPITTADQIPQTFGQQYLYEPNIALGSNISVEYLSNGSSPNYNTYAQYVTTDQGNSNSYSIESQDSTQSLWYGSVWERNRKFVKAR